MKIRTRYAPSPTGKMHVGNLRTALYEYLIAKHEGGDFLFRIEDTDTERYVDGAIDIINNTMKMAGLEYDEGPGKDGGYGPYVQSERVRSGLYLEYAKKLVEKGEAYYCFCSKERLEKLRADSVNENGKETAKYDKHCLSLTKEEVEAKLAAGEPYVIRQNNPVTGTTVFSDIIYGDITVDNSELDDMILIKSDGYPTYNFANVVDDHLMAISHVMRGMEYLSSAPKYNLLYKAFGWEIPQYIHMPPIMRDAQHKLSKRDGDASYEDFINKGYLKEAIINYIALLGWNPGDERERFTLAELCEVFDVDRMSKSPAIFDPAKLTWLNGQYIRDLSPADFTAHAAPWYQQAGISHMDTAVLCRILQPRVEIFSQIPDMVDFLAALPKDYNVDLFTNKKSKTNPEVSKAVLQAVIPLLEALPQWTETALHDTLLGYAAQQGMKNGTLLWPVRIALAGKQVTPGGAIEIAFLLGREEALDRLRFGLEKL